VMVDVQVREAGAADAAVLVEMVCERVRWR
jgi:hypothetical protein